MSETLVSGTAAGREILEKLDVLVATKPMAWGDGQILAWLVANMPAIIALVKQIIALFSQPTPAPTPGPTV